MLRSFLLRMIGGRAAAKGRQISKHEFKVQISVPTDTRDPEAAEAAARDLQAQILEELAAGGDPATVKSRLEAIARNEGGKLDQFEES